MNFQQTLNKYKGIFDKTNDKPIFINTIVIEIEIDNVLNWKFDFTTKYFSTVIINSEKFDNIQEKLAKIPKN